MMTRTNPISSSKARTPQRCQNLVVSLQNAGATDHRFHSDCGVPDDPVGNDRICRVRAGRAQTSAPQTKMKSRVVYVLYLTAVIVASIGWTWQILRAALGPLASKLG
jgi:hypothetical protein